MSDRLVLLGTGTCQLETHRMATAALLELGELRLVYDFGRGVATRLTGLGLRQDDIEHVVLSHFHPDHLSDLIPFLHAAAWSRIDPRSKDLHIYGPPGLEVQMMRLLSLFDANTLVREHYRVVLHEISSERLSLGDHNFIYADLPPASNRGLKWKTGEKTYALTGDSSFHQKEVDFLRGVDIAVIDSGHLNDEEIVELAARTQASRIICSHHYRELDLDDLNRRAQARGYAGRLEIGEDLDFFEI